MAEPSFIKVYSNFESGSISDNLISGSDWYYEYPSNNPNAMMRSSVQKRMGSYSNKVLLQASDSPAQYGSTRAELSFNNSSNPNTSLRWYAWSSYMPLATYAYDNEEESIIQWHDKSANCSTSPPFCIQSKKGRFRAMVSYSYENYCTGPKYNYPLNSWDGTDIGPIVYDKWNDWVVYYDPKYDATGRIQIWLNKVLVFNYTGPCHYNGSQFPYVKIGTYKWGWDGSSPSDTTKREYYIDEVRIGDTGGNVQYFFDVLGGTPTTTTTTTTTKPTTTTTTTTKGTTTTTTSTTRTTTTTTTTKINSAPVVKIRKESDTVVGYLGKTIVTADVVSINPIVSYLWEQVAGPAATINSPTTLTTSLLELPLGEYIFKLTVTDSQGQKSSDSLILTVSTTFLIQGY